MYDFGFGSGIFLKEAVRLGLDCFGYEYSDGLIEKGMGLGATIEDAEQLHSHSSPKVDIFIVIETLEHLVHPQEVLQTAFHRLNERGVLYMTTPNARSLNRRLLGGRWSVFNPPEHITLFSAESVRFLLRDIGFTDISISTTGFNPHDLVRAVQSKSRSTDSDFSYDGTKRTETSRSLISLSDGNILFRFLFNMVNGLLKLFKNGDSLKVIARKQ
jgi:SAM-dependent methyltransferase